MHVSFFTLFWQADFVVKMVILLLLAASVWSWHLMVTKTLELKDLERLKESFVRAFWGHNTSLESLYNRFAKHPKDPFASSLSKVLQELPPSFPNQKLSPDEKNDLENRITKSLTILHEKEVAKIQHGLGHLASLSSSAVFVGLFGTVWGIMQSFQAIAASGSTSLAVVAPAISEALFATALGLFVAIPASVGYNRLLNLTEDYRTKWQVFCAEMTHSFLSEIKLSAPAK